MIYGFSVENYTGDRLDFTLSDGTPEHGLIVKEITGMGPPKGVISVSNFANKDGGIFNSSRIEKRTMTFTFIIKGNPDVAGGVEYSRDLLYKIFPVKRQVHLIFDRMDHRKADIYGYVESNEPGIFSTSCPPYEESTITVICDDPYFRKHGPGSIQSTRFGYTEPLFEFPFSNEAGKKELIFGKFGESMDRNIVYEGDADAGVKMTIHVIFPYVGNYIEIYNISTKEYMVIHIDKILKKLASSGLHENDEIQICTERLNHTAVFIRDGIETSCLYAIDRMSDWIQLQRGNNVLVYAVESNTEYNIDFHVENKILYEGI